LRRFRRRSPQTASTTSSERSWHGVASQGSQPFTAMAIMTLVTDDERLADLRSYTE
jgi:hypothetical protein